MPIRFQRSIGADGDRKELEYIIALHQTCIPDTRDNATVSSTDIISMLLSRYSLRITHQEALNVVRSLGGGDTTMVLGNNNGKKQKPSSSSSSSSPQNDEKTSNAASTNHTKPSQSVSTDHTSSVNDKGNHSKKDDDERNNNIQGIVVSESNANNEATGVTTTNGHTAVESGDPNQVEMNDDEAGGGVAAEGQDVKPEGVVDDEEQQQHDEYLDLVQILSVILIPTIARAADEDRNGVEPHKTVPKPPDDASFYVRKIHHPLKARVTELGNTHYEKQRPHPKGKAFFDHALSALLKDVVQVPGGNTEEESPFMMEELVRKLLLKHGELERAENEHLIREMAQAAQSSSGRLDREALINAMSSDLSEWNVGSEDDVSTFFADVFHQNNPRKVTSLYEERPKKEDVHHDDDEEVMEIASKASKPPTEHRSWCNNSKWGWRGRVFDTETANIDTVVDAHSSLWTHVLIFLFYLLTVIVYGSQLIPDLKECGVDFGCTVAVTVVLWLVVAAILSLFGIICIAPLSMGNNPFQRSWVHVMFALVVSLGYTIVPFVGYTSNWTEVVEEVEEPDAFLRQFKFLQLLTLISGSVLSLVFALHMIFPFVVKCTKYKPRFPRFFAHVTSSSNIRGESSLKWAATRKLNALLVNADGLHGFENGCSDSQDMQALAVVRNTPSTKKLMMTRNTKKALRNVTDETMRNYLLHGEQFEIVGGFFWTWKRIFNESLFADEGIWINSRLIVFQVCMAVVAAAFAYFLLWSVGAIAQKADDAREANLNNDPRIPDWVDDLIPTGEMVRTALEPAAYIAIISSYVLILVYVPSMASKVMKYRSQTLPSLGSPRFVRYRDHTNLVYMNTANAVYAMIGSAALFYMFVGFVVFLFVWPPTEDYAMIFLAICIGASITILLKMAVQSFFKRVQYRSFYRIRPRGARWSSLALECWFIGLGASVMIGRVLAILLAALFWVGRIDATFLEDDVRLPGYYFDYYPTYFIQDILVHEAHRHPYLERLAQMYLMKLHHRDRFVSHAGAAWRQLFVVSFLPWLARYRVFHDERYAEAMVDLDARQKQEEEEDDLGGWAGLAGLRSLLAALGMIATAKEESRHAIVRVANSRFPGNALGGGSDGD